MRIKRVMAAVVALLSLITTVGCGSTQSQSAVTSKGGDLVIARSADAQAMDNTTTFDNNSIFVQEQIMEPLFTVTDNGQSVKPWLAKSYVLSKDGLTYTVKLRSGVKFSNGAPMTAKDVKFSIDADSATASNGWGYINDAIDKVTVVDNQTVQFKLKYKWAPFLADLALFSNGIVPADYGGKSKADFYKAPVGTGPFKWGKWVKGQYLKLVKNTHYWQTGKPYLNSVTWKVVPDSNTRKLQLQGGQIDIDEYPDWSSFKSLQNLSGITAKTYTSTYESYISLNQKKKPLDDIHVRRAIAYAIDRKTIVKSVLFGNGKVANSLLSPGTPYYDKNAGGLEYNLSEAKAEMTKAGSPKGFTVNLLIASGDSTQSSIAQIVQAELKRIGITVKIQILDPTANKQARNAGNFEMAIEAWTMDIPDPDEWTTFAVDPAGGSSSAFTHYNNPEVVALNKQAQKTTDSSDRQRLYSSLQKKTSADSFLAYLYYAPYQYAFTDKVSHFFVTPLGNYHLEDVSKQS